MIKHLIVSLLFVLLVKPVSFAQTDTLSIVSWNVFLRPGVLSDGQMERVDSIANYLIESDADVLVLQEVFHRRSRKRLNHLLKDKYPNQTKVGPKSFFFVPSGVAIYTKQEFNCPSPKHISYRKATGSDKLARKGFVHYNFSIKGRKVSILGTHLQAGSGAKRKYIRMNQLKSLTRFQRKIDDSSIVLSAGDFNIKESSTYMDSVLISMKSVNKRPAKRLKFTANFSDHDLFSTQGKPIWIDFILLRNSPYARTIKTVIESPRQIVDGKSTRLSDHNPIKSWIEIL